MMEIPLLWTLLFLIRSALELLAILDSVCEKGDTASNSRVQRFLAMKRVYNYRQGDETDIGEYLYRFEILVNIAEKLGCTFHEETDIEEAFKLSKRPMIGIDGRLRGWDKWNEVREECREEIIGDARQRALSMIFYMNSNDNKFAIHKQQNQNAMAKGRDEYPTTVIEAHTELEDFKFNPKYYQVRNNNLEQQTNQCCTSIFGRG